MLYYDIYSDRSATAAPIASPSKYREAMRTRKIHPFGAVRKGLKPCLGILVSSRYTGFSACDADPAMARSRCLV